MVNFPPVDTGSNRINKIKKTTGRQVSASSATESRETQTLIDRRHMKERRDRGAKQTLTKHVMDRRLIRDRRRSSIDLTV